MAPKSKVIARAILILVLFTALRSWSGTFQTELFSLTLPDNWNCDPAETVFICTEAQPKTKKSSVVVINYGPKSSNDSLAYFSRVYGTPRILNPNSKMPIRSKVESLTTFRIDDRDYIKALHFEGELADYYTYYLATVTDSHIFLFNFSAHKEDWPEYKLIFENTMPSIKVSATSANTTTQPSFEQEPPRLTVGADQPPIEVVAPVQTRQGGTPAGNSGGITKSHIFLFISVVSLGLVGLYALRS